MKLLSILSPCGKIFRTLIASFLAIATFASASAQFSVFSVEGDVRVKHAGVVVAASKGMKVNVTDVFYIKPGDVIEILDSRDSKIYKADMPGDLTVTGIMVAAKKQAKEHSSAVNNNLRIGKTDNRQTTVYIEKGKVTRALDVFDPTSENLQVDPAKLGKYIGEAFRDHRAELLLDTFPVEVIGDTIGTDGRSFELVNTLGFPVYFNVLKIDPDSENGVEISELGQPVGCYVVLPGQRLMREQPDGLVAGGLHMVMVTHYYFEVDEVIESIRHALRDSDPAESEDEYPVFIKII